MCSLHGTYSHVTASRPDIRYVSPPSTVPVGGVLNYETCTPVVRRAVASVAPAKQLHWACLTYGNISCLAFRTVPCNVNCIREIKVNMSLRTMLNVNQSVARVELTVFRSGA